MKRRIFSLPAGALDPEKVIAARELLDWTPKELAEAADVNLALLCRFERGQVAVQDIEDSELLRAIFYTLRRHGVFFKEAGPVRFTS
ncbi:MAG TPA: hypothetical protein VGP83_17265 [Pyrinomonadaceae bacterium]|jgi:transcriptional regulator with XRE-family HTH domain|nr:hypothetical protein [Pyrinomonadaceae bacterium]